MAKFGLYGNLAPKGMVYSAASVTTFTQLFDWGWLTPPYPYNNPYYGSTIKAAGRRNILRCSFWDGDGIYPTYTNWTQLRAGGTSAFQAAVTAMSYQINQAGASNLYGYSMYEEEPADSCAVDSNGNWIPPTQSQIADFIYCVNTLYTMMKAAFPSLPIMQNPHIMDWFTDAQLQSISFDLLEVHSYSSDLPTLQAYLQRGLKIANGKEMFTLLYCGTSASYDPPGDPTYLAQAVAIAEAVGVTNIGIYCYRRDKPGSGEQIIFNTYTETSPPPAAWVDPYLHYQAIIAVLSSTPPQTLIFNPIGNQTVAVGSSLKILLSATDAPGLTLTFSADNMPTGASLQSDNYFRWTPTASQVGSYPNVYFQVSDGTNTASQYITITVTGNGYTHGTSHTAALSITELPAGKSCQVQIQVGTSLSSKVSFTSGSNVPVSVPITMPAAGTYSVYIDVYMEGVLIQTGTDPDQVTVV